MQDRVAACVPRYILQKHDELVTHLTICGDAHGNHRVYVEICLRMHTNYTYYEI